MTNAVDVPVMADQAVAAYVVLRDKKDEEKKKFDNRVKQLDDAMQQLENYILNLLVSTGVESFRTSAGTAYINDRVTYSVTDWESLKKFVVENNAFDLLTHGVAKESVDNFVTDTKGMLPPGVKMAVFRKLGVRRA